ncbi:EAL domain-containing protein (putative c-di-GMP-specific phosphodiesterase class I) [Rahnella inusitata]|uniref:sensor domain-containing phosphodiesterase n=1 Tax=Rahnella rivi TaxID=2816249 RepID=UPI0010A47604|nr:EAL domain-containing protein [Rahnella rivi]MBB6116015.1 EAL domain-containing protein (putative c-di-GMP-specific phosphodiesterase class I) [Rahnella inusitata]MBU9832995.1 sensor domain-containing phosphodiesterase [Rahnella rivi]THD51107.1 sensor domain-containing phosphodiesterase [Enterobacteriaceae bacterium ML5]
MDPMQKLFSWNELRHKWWGLPIFCALVLIPLSSSLSPIIFLPEGRTYLIYMPLATCVALLMVFDWAAFPGIVLTLFLRYYLRVGAEMGTLMTVIYFTSLFLAWLGYRWQAGSRWSAPLGLMNQAWVRVGWLLIFLTFFFIIVLQIVVESGLLPEYLGMATRDFMTLRTLINLQAMILGILLNSHLIYLIIRIIRRPRYWRVLRMMLRKQCAPGVKPAEMVLWFIVLGTMVALLCIQGLSEPFMKILLSDYTLTLLFPVLLFGALRYGYYFISIVWTITLTILFHYYQGFISETNFVHNLVFVSALMLVYTITLLLMAVISSRQRLLMKKFKAAALQDPVFALPNLRAFNRDLAIYPRSLLCFVRVSDMDVLSRNYGMQLRIQFKQQLAMGLKPYLQPGEKVYHLPGYDLVLRLNSEDVEGKLQQLYEYVEDFRLIWNGLPLHPNIGLSYCTVYSPVEHLPILLGELSGIAEVSLTTGKPESNKSDHSQVQLEIREKVDMLHKIQRALDDDRFVLMAQPISGVRGDNYYEILLRMFDGAQENLVMPDKFLPVVHEFGLSYQLDMWVLRHTLMFINANRSRLPSLRFAVNFTPSTLCRPTFTRDFKTLMAEFEVEPFQIVLEVTESHLLQDVKYADSAMRELRNYGCRIAIDDFGTGYASYGRLKAIQADIIKIDGSFVRNMLTNSLDGYIVQSICQVARMKHLSIVAEYVETEEQKAALHALGVDYMQGYLVGKPEPLASLLAFRKD